MTDLLKRLEKGSGKHEDLNVIADICKQIAGRSFCALGDAASGPYPGAIKHFRAEFEAAVETPVDSVFDPAATTVFAKVN
jgi:NADH-quinone oxidoreductase subunit F